MTDDLLVVDLARARLVAAGGISDVDVEIGPETKNGCLLVNIRYTVAATNSQDNLVFPFYLNAAREEPTL